VRNRRAEVRSAIRALRDLCFGNAAGSRVPDPPRFPLMVSTHSKPRQPRGPSFAAARRRGDRINFAALPVAGSGGEVVGYSGSQQLVSCEGSIDAIQAQSIAALHILGGLPDKMPVEVDRSIGVSAKTVGELRKLTAWPAYLV
jgi:hypothetical protein